MTQVGIADAVVAVGEVINRIGHVVAVSNIDIAPVTQIIHRKGFIVVLYAVMGALFFCAVFSQ